jgi:hypothetical protein
MKIARFLDVELTPERVSEIAAQTTFETMVRFLETIIMKKKMGNPKSPI